MADRPKKIVVDCSTGESSLVELTDEEITERDTQASRLAADEQAQNDIKAQREASKASAISKLTALGLTEEEALAISGS
jgi:adenylate kinase